MRKYVREMLFPLFLSIEAGQFHLEYEDHSYCGHSGDIILIDCSRPHRYYVCLLYTSDAADEEDSVDLGGRRIHKKKKKKKKKRKKKKEMKPTR